MKAIIAKSWPLVLLALVVVLVAGCAAAGPGGAAAGGIAGSVLAIVLTIVGATIGGVAATGCTSVSGRACGLDADDDGACADEDCNDSDPTVFPGAVESRCDDGIDQDCDGNDGGDDARCMPPTTPPTTPPTPPTPPQPPPEPPPVSMNTCTDADGDGYGYGFCPGIDCDDSDPTVHPGALDSDCDSVDSDCDPAGPVVSCNPMPEDVCCDHVDSDGDGRDDPRGVACNCCYDDDGDGFGIGACRGEPDCDDADATVFPGNVNESSLTAPDAWMWCADGKDNDCDGTTDWADPECPVINGMLDDVPEIDAEPEVAWPPAGNDDDGGSRQA